MKRGNDQDLVKKSFLAFDSVRALDQLTNDLNEERDALLLDIIFKRLVEVDRDYDYETGLRQRTEETLKRLSDGKHHAFEKRSDNKFCSVELCETKTFAEGDSFYSWTQKQWFVATGNVFVCIFHGSIHVCTPERCQAKIYADSHRSDVICSITGRSFGPELSASISDQSFEERTRAPFGSREPAPLNDVVVPQPAKPAAKRRKRLEEVDGFRFAALTSEVVPTMAQSEMRQYFRSSSTPYNIGKHMPAEMLPRMPAALRQLHSPDLIPLGQQTAVAATQVHNRLLQQQQQPEFDTPHQKTLWERASCLHIENPHTAERIFNRNSLQGRCEQLCAIIVGRGIAEVKRNLVAKVIEMDHAAEREASDYCKQRIRYNEQPNPIRIIAIYARKLVQPMSKLKRMGLFDPGSIVDEREHISYLSECMVALWFIVHGTPLGSREMSTIDKLCSGIFFYFHRGLSVSVRLRKRDQVVMPLPPPAPTAAATAAAAAATTTPAASAPTYRRKHNISNLRTATAALLPPAPPPPSPLLTAEVADDDDDDDDDDEFETIPLRFVPKLEFLKNICGPSDLSKSIHDVRLQTMVESSRFIKQCFLSLLEETHPLSYFDPYLLENHIKPR